MVREKASIAAAKSRYFRQGFVRGATIACCAADVLPLRRRHCPDESLAFEWRREPALRFFKTVVRLAAFDEVSVFDGTLEGGGHDASRADHRSGRRDRPLLA